MVYREVIDFFTKTNKGRLILVFSSMFIIFSVIIFVGMIPKNEAVDRLAASEVKNLKDTDSQLLNTVGIDMYSAFIYRLYEFLDSKNIPKGAPVFINKAESQNRDGSHVDVYVNIPALKKDNLLIQLRFDYDLDQEMFIIPDYNYNIVLYK